MTGLNRDLNRERKRIQMSAANSAAVKKGDDKVETQSLKELLLGNARSYGIFFALVVVIIVFQILTGGRLLNPNNVVALFQQNAYVLIAAIGMLMVIIGGVGALAMKNWGLNWFLAIVLMIVIGLAIGAWHGFWVAYVGVPGFVTTLGGMLIFRGLATVVAGESIPVSDPTFRAISKDYLPNVLGFWGDFSSNAIIVGVVAIVLVIWTYLLACSGNATQGGIPIVMLIIGVLIGVYWFALNRTVYGRNVYAVGGNRKAAILSGIDTKATDFKIFLNMGFLTSIAAVIIPGAMVGALIMGVLNQGLSIMGVDAAWVKTIKGLVVIAAVAYDLVSKRKKG